MERPRKKAKYEFDSYLFMAQLPPRPEMTTVDLLPPCSRHTLVLDLDETLVHSKMNSESGDFVLNVGGSIGVKCRPFLDEFLRKAAKLFEVVVFTASHQAYAETVLDKIDPTGKITHRLFRDACSSVDGLYLKDLELLGRDLSKVIIVDNTPYVFAYQPDNAIPVDSWYDDQDDTVLSDLLPFLENLAKEDDVRPLLRSTFHVADKIQQALFVL